MKLAPLVLLLALGVAPQDRPPVIVNVRPAFGQMPGIEWRTFLMELENTSADEFDIRASIFHESGGHRAVQNVKLAARARKRLFFYLPGSSGWRPSFEVVAGSRTLAKGHFDVNTVSKGYHSSALTTFALVLMDRRPVVAPPSIAFFDCPPEHLPDRWIAFQGFDVAFMRDYPLDRLLPAQRAALLEWVRRGGLLVVSPGSNRDWLTTAAFSEFATVALGDSEELTSFRELEDAHGRFRERTPFVCHRFKNGEPLGAGKPWASLYRNGRGTVVVLAFDVERPPFDSWPGAADFREALVAKVTPPAAPGRASARMEAVRGASTADVNQLPPFLLLFFLAVIFIVAVGPVNYLVLRRLRMTMLIVVTVPAISALFLLIVIGAGYVLRGTSVVTREVVFLDARSGEDSALEAHYLTIFSPSARTFDITWNGTEVGTVVDDDEHGYLTFDQTAAWTIKECPFTQWQARTFVGYGARPLGGSVTFRVESDGLRVNNLTPYVIRKGVYVDSGAGYLAFEEVPPSSERLFKKQPTTVAPRFKPDDLEGRFLENYFNGWYHYRSEPGRYLVCVLDRVPDEVKVDGASSSDRLGILQVNE